MGFLSDATAWDVDRFAAKVKNPRVKADGSVLTEDTKLEKYFPAARFGHISQPATILDAHHRIIAWHLPGILHFGRVVLDA